MKGELKLSNEAYGWAVSAFFWVYAPVQLFAGWLCDRFSVYKLLAGGILIWAVSTLLMDRRRIASLLVLRIARHRRSPPFRAVRRLSLARLPSGAALPMRPRDGIALGPAVGTLGGGFILNYYGWRAIFITFGLVTLLWLAPWRQAVRGLSTTGHFDDGPKVDVGVLIGKWPLWSMSIVHCLGNYCFYFILAWLPLFLTSILTSEWVYLATLPCRAGACALPTAISQTGGHGRADRKRPAAAG
jgi:MFS family permease